MPIARSVRPDEVDRAGEVGAIAFEKEVTDTALADWRRAFRDNVEMHGHDAVIVAEHEGTVVSSMKVIPEGMRMGDATVPAVAVAGVGTVPEARRVGCAAAMLEEAARRMRAWGAVASPMWPFSFVYYRKFGWEIGGEVRVAMMPRDITWKIPPRGEVSSLTREDVADVAALWDEASARHRCATTADTRGLETRFQRLLEKPEWGGLACRDGGEAAGYVVYRNPEPKEGEEPKPVEVLELCARHEGARIALLSALTQRLDAASFRLHLAPGDRLRSVAVDPRALQTAMETSFGFRVIDPRRILELMRTVERLEPVALRVEDRLLGGGTWRVALDGGPAAVEGTSAAPELVCSIEAFSQIASGFLKPTDAFRAGLLTGEPAAALRLEAATRHWTLPFRAPTERG